MIGVIMMARMSPAVMKLAAAGRPAEERAEDRDRADGVGDVLVDAVRSAGREHEMPHRP